MVVIRVLRYPLALTMPGKEQSLLRSCVSKPASRMQKPATKHCHQPTRMLMCSQFYCDSYKPPGFYLRSVRVVRMLHGPGLHRMTRRTCNISNLSVASRHEIGTLRQLLPACCTTSRRDPWNAVLPSRITPCPVPGAKVGLHFLCCLHMM